MSGFEKKWLIVGFGSDLGGDDRFGLVVAQAVAQAVCQGGLKKRANISVLTQRILAPELVEEIRAASDVVFIDASATIAPGVLKCIDLPDQRQTSRRSISDGHDQAEKETDHPKGHNPAIVMSHHCDPDTLLQLTETLYGTRPRARLFAVGGGDFGLSETMSGPVAAIVPEVVSKIMALLAEPPT